MDGVAIQATNVVFQVLRAQEVGMLFTKFMTAEASPGSFLAREAGKADDLGRIGRFRMFLAWPVTSFAALPLRTRMFGQFRLPMRSLTEALELFFVAGFAGVRAHILRRIHFVVIDILRGQV